MPFTGSLSAVASYLYPFSIEFNILVGMDIFIKKDFNIVHLSFLEGCVHDLIKSFFAAGIWYMMWSNIGNVAEHKNSIELLPSGPRHSIDSGTGVHLNDAMYVYANCHSAIKGIFLGNQIISSS